MKQRINDLADLFANYSIYPKACFSEGTPVSLFRLMYPDNHYCYDLGTFLEHQAYEPKKRGADLPWWGSHYFGEDKKLRVMIISQDSLSKDAGSIVFFAHLMEVVKNESEYRSYTAKLKDNRPFSFKSWQKIKTKILSWGINLDFLYITDGAKVYKDNSWKDRDFNYFKSKELLESEIRFCDPDLLIILGAQSLHLLDRSQNYKEAVESGSDIPILGKRTVVAPFLCGNGPSQKNFNERLLAASKAIKKVF